MSKKDYKLLAEAINKTLWDCGDGFRVRVTLRTLCENLAEPLKQDNELFNEDKFLKAALPTDN